jgi:hypothetical protein
MFSDVPTFLRCHRFALTAVALITIGIVLRLALNAIGWPVSNSEEGTLGLEAMHILLRGDHPMYYYGQNYMGVAEAYAGAVAFQFFGISVFSLRLGMIAFDAIFLASVCWLASLLYSRRVALVALAALALPWPFLMEKELLADGGKPETLASSALMFALAAWLALTRPVTPLSRRQRRVRYGAFAAWGLVAGFGLYTYLVVAPFVFASALLLWFTCRRELRGWPLICAGAGLLVGLLPPITFVTTLTMTHNLRSALQFVHEQTGGANGANVGWHGWNRLLEQVEAPFFYSLPQATGLKMPYSLQNVPLYGPPGPGTAAAIIVGTTWSLTYLSLLAMATYRPLKGLNLSKMRDTTWSLTYLSLLAMATSRSLKGLNLSKMRETARRSSQDAQKWPTADSRAEALNVARVMLALAGWLTIAAYVVKSGSDPTTARYLIGLTTVFPAVLWPLVEAIRRIHSRRELLRAAWAPVIMLLLTLNLIHGGVSLIQGLPATVASNEGNAKFDRDLLSHGITRMYSDYWTCGRVTFATHERVICSTLKSSTLLPYSRYAPYDAEVAAYPQAPVLLPRSSSLETAFLAHAAAAHQLYTVERLDNYDVYTPVSPPG